MEKIEIVDYAPKYRDDFARLNLAWIEKYFKVEEPDRQALGDPEANILDKGGYILLARYGDTIVGAVALIKESGTVYELAKMAVDEAYQGKQIGKKLCLAAIEKARAIGAVHLDLESNTALVPAINLYYSVGFKRVEQYESPYERANIKMVLDLADQNQPMIKALTLDQYPVLAELAPKSFVESFASHNTEADMEKYMAKAFSHDRILLEFVDSGNRFFIAYLENVAVGYTKLRTSEPPEALQHQNSIELERIYVLKHYHDQKVGAGLMRHSIEYAKAHGFDTLWLGVWEHNNRALQFYQRWGFEVIGSHEFMLGDDLQTDLLLKLDVQS